MPSFIALRKSDFISRLVICAFISGAVTPALGAKQLVMKLVGAVGSRIVTNRDVEANYLVDRALYNDGAVQPLGIGTEEFNGALNRLLIEIMVFEEANTFGVAKVPESEVDEALSSVRRRLATTPTKSRWGALGYAEGQLKEMVLRKLRANRFIKYKSNSSFVQVSDEEARDYFNRNRLRFGTMEFDSFKSSIKKYLGKKNAEDRLRDWFEILRKKHKVKNLQHAGLKYDSSSQTGQ
jgi:hypothetical protein